MKTKTLFRILFVLVLLSAWLPVAGVRAEVGLQKLPAESIIYVPGPTNITLQTAIDQVPDGGVIEIANGVYTASGNGFQFLNLNKSFTIRAAAGANVILDGGSAVQTVWAENTSYSTASAVTISGITFANHNPVEEGKPAIRFSKVNFTFVNTTFLNNLKGGVVYAESSHVFFFDCLWEGNGSSAGGAGFRSWDSNMYVYNSRFVDNYTTALTTSSIPAGAAIATVNGVLWVSNTRFESNRSGAHGGAIWATGEWAKPETHVYIANSTFINNGIERSVGKSTPMEGGALVFEDQVFVHIYNSRFIENFADLGGAISFFRCKAEIRRSVFQSNYTVGSGVYSGVGGAITMNFYDRQSYASLTIEDTLFQGRPGHNVYDATFGGGLDVYGIVSSVKPKVTLRRVIFNDLDISDPTYAAAGGALIVKGVDFLMEDSFVLNSTANTAKGGLGGGLMIYPSNIATINRTVFANNVAAQCGGGAFMQGSTIRLNGNLFVGNAVSPSTPESASCGAALYTGTQSTLMITGTVENSTFVNNLGLPILEGDNSGSPINGVVYNGNSFYETAFSGTVFHNALVGGWTVAQLNTGVVTHTGGQPNITKSVVDNVALDSAPDIAKILAAPGNLLSAAANGDSAQQTSAYLAYVWNGASATLNGQALSDRAGVQAVNTAATYVLAAGSASNSAVVVNSTMPAFAFTFTPSSPAPILNWNLTGGNFLGAAMDQGVALTSAASGSVQLPTTNKQYRFHGLTQEGGFVGLIDPLLPVLSAPETAAILIDLSNPNYIGNVPFSNAGGQSLQWTASTSTPGLLQVTTPSGTTVLNGVVLYQVVPLATGEYTGTLTIDAGAGGSQDVTIQIHVVDRLQPLFLPLVMR